MGTRNFDIVFDGSVINGSDPLEVKARVKQLFKLDDAAIEKLFSGQPIAIKRNVDRKTATQYQAAMTGAGASVQLVLHQAADQQAAASPSSAADTTTAEPQSATAAPTATSNDWTLAAAGSPLLSEQDKPVAPPPVSIDTSHLALLESGAAGDAAPSNPFLAALEQSEAAATSMTDDAAAPRYPEPDISNAPEYAFKSSAQIDADTAHRASELEQVIGAAQQQYQQDFGLAEAGTNLVEASERDAIAAVEIDLSHLSLESH